MRAAGQHTIAEFVTRHGTDDQWMKPLADDNRLGAYTYELQRALIRPDGRSVLLVGTVDDIISLGADRYEVRDRDLQTLDVGLTIQYFLQCGTEELAALLSSAPEYAGSKTNYAIAATITRVSKPMFKGSPTWSRRSITRAARSRLASMTCA